MRVWSQTPSSAAGGADAGGARAAEGASVLPLSALTQWAGLPVLHISIAGIAAARVTPLRGQLVQAEGAPLSRKAVEESLRRLFLTGVFKTLEVEGVRKAGGVDLIFRGTPSMFIGTVSVDGAHGGGTVDTQLKLASQLAPGTRLTPAKLSQAVVKIRALLAQDGFYQPAVTYTLTPHPAEQLTDVAFHVVSGPEARVGAVEVTGESGMTVSEFRSHAHLRAGSRVNSETVSRALAGVLKVDQDQDRLEAEIKLVSQQYDAKRHTIDYRFSASRGPVVRVVVEGARISPDRVRQLVPIFAEGSVDEDLLNEGNRRLRDYYQRQGYFDAKVAHEKQPAGAGETKIVYKVKLGPRRRVQSVSIAGNHYFGAATLKDLLSVHAADTLDRHGAYSQALVAADINTLEAVYRNNGFSQVSVAAETSAGDVKAGKTRPLTVVYYIMEGPQLRVGAVRLEGNAKIATATLLPQLNTIAGQPLSPENLAGDRDTLLTDYLNRGFDQARVQVAQQTEPADHDKVDVVFHITEGRQIFVRNVLMTGLHYTRPGTVAKAITLHPGNPLNQTALIETQRNLYDLALFNEVDTAVENPAGAETHKTVLIQAEEARRWVLTYGVGLEAQTGTPQNNCASAIAGGVPCNPNGKTGISPRGLIDITRNDLFGRAQSLSLRGNYGLLEQKVDLLFQNPHFEGNRNFGLTLSGGYANSLDVSTYVASKLEGSIRWTENFNTPGSFLSKANTFLYDLNFRRVKVEASSLQVFPAEIAPLSTAVRVAGPSFTWIRDTRDSPLDAHRGTYTSFQEFLSDPLFGAQVDFNRLDLSNSSYYGFAKGRFVLARNTRYAQERAFGPQDEELIPLPERIYAGGATSLRGFGENSAGPRDPETGYPIGGAGALIESTELRLPPPTLPWVGNTVSFVLFEDMGNVFTNAGDAWASIFRYHQPDRAACENLATYGDTTADKNSYNPSGPNTSTGQQGNCSFNYFSQAPGIGLRYHTPVGPLRLDFSYNLNPPIYPVNIDYSLSIPDFDPHVGEARHFNVFFSLGQSF